MDFLLDNGKQLSRADLSSYITCIESLAAAERLLVCLPSSLELAHVIINAYRCNLVTIPLDPKQSVEQRAFVEKHSQPSAKLLDLGIVQQFSEQQDKSAPELRFIMYTSGSTGNPKGVMLSNKAVEHNALSMSKIHHFSDGHATCLPLFHCNALMMSLLGCYLTESPLLVISKFNPFEYFRLIEQHSIRTASFVPALLHELVIAAPKWPDCLEYVISAAAPVSQELARQFFKRYGCRLRQGYGLTEATNFSFLMPKLNEQEFFDEYINQYPPVGQALPNNKFRIMDGEIHVKGPSIMDGYWKNDEETARTITNDGWLRTGDLGELRGEYLVLKGRIKEIINRGGETFYPVDIEQSWESFGLTAPFAAVSIENNLLSEDIGLWVGHKRIDELAELKESSATKPSAVHFGQLKITATNKPQRKKMAQFLVSHNESKQVYDVLYAWVCEFAACLKSYFSQIKVELPSNMSLMMDELLLWQNTLEKTELQKSQVIDSLRHVRIMMDSLLESIKFSGILNSFELFKTLGSKIALRELWPFDIYRRLAQQLAIKWLNSEEIDIVELKPSLSIEEQLTKNHTKFTVLYLDHMLCYEGHKEKKLQLLFNTLAKTDMLLVAEANPVSCINNSIWPFRMLYCLCDGEQFSEILPRLEWLKLFEKVGFNEYGYSVVRAGRYDLGSVFWAMK